MHGAKVKTYRALANSFVNCKQKNRECHYVTTTLVYTVVNVQIVL